MLGRRGRAADARALCEEEELGLENFFTIGGFGLGISADSATNGPW